jgi:RNA polymerase-binding transcription factor DksA
LAKDIMDDFKHVRENLVEMLEELDKRLGKITKDVKKMDESVDNPDKKTGKHLGSGEDITSAKIFQIEQTISKIDAGVYGICLQCGQSIKKEHSSETCIHCTK